MPDQDFNLSEFLPYRLAFLSERISKRLSLVYGDTYGLSIAEWRVIAHLSRTEKVSVREIRDCVNLEKPRVSRAVAKLQAAGLVRKSAGKGDHRLVEISLTAKGRGVLYGIAPEALEYEKTLLDALSPEEAQTFLNVVEKLHDVLDNDPRALRRGVLDTQETSAKDT